MNLHIIPDWHAYSLTLPEFNDSVHQTQLFLSQGQAVELILVDYLPKLRQILSDKAIESAQTWSVYDLLQQISIKEAKPVALSDFSWPENAQFVYMTDCINVQVAGKYFATISLEYPAWTRFEKVDLWSGDRHTQELLIDDRGFISRVTTFDDNAAILRRDYLTPSGDVAVQEDYTTGVVMTQQTWTTQTTFTTMSELIAAALAHHLQTLPENEYLIFAQSQRANFFINKVAPKQPIILNYQAKRTNEQLAKNILLKNPDRTRFSVTDTKEQYGKIITQLNHAETLAVIPPYVAVKKHNRREIQPFSTIYWQATTITPTAFDAVGAVIANHPNIVVLIETAQSHTVFDELIAKNSLTAANEHGIVDSDSQMAYKTRFQFLPPQTEVQRTRYIANTRILLDLSERPDQFLQTQAISFGVPQINMVQTEYLIPNKNGQLLSDYSELIDALNFYLDDNHHLSETQEMTHQMVTDFSDDMVWIKWQQIFNKIKQRNL
ncbi:accessory Sec system protein Asp1 [uncultured Leuconostoc sp.]|uniref:accessory Sec system protein Asp1 n=1 Tax=uncultured Leuconostoc sp. TaxID=173262 RepID=UPI0025F1E5DA|nr:accessory Sec system protein Asp1 [uncultured Leuconostoc sp.]